MNTPTDAEIGAYIGAAGKAAWEVPDLPANTKQREIKSVGIIGAGTMGGGIAMNFATAGIPVTIVETTQEALDRGLKVVRGNYQRSADKGRFPQEEVEARMDRFDGKLELAALAECDLVIEAVFEDMELKRKIFTELDRVMKPGAILATNTEICSWRPTRGSFARSCVVSPVGSRGTSTAGTCRPPPTSTGTGSA